MLLNSKLSGETTKISSPSETTAVNFHAGVFVKVCSSTDKFPVQNQRMILILSKQVDGMGYNVTRQEVASTMERHGKVKFVEMIKSGRESKTCCAIVRFDRAFQAKAAISDCDIPSLGGEVPKMSLIEGECGSKFLPCASFPRKVMNFMNRFGRGKGE